MSQSYYIFRKSDISMSFSMLAFPGFSRGGCSPSCSASRVAQGVALKFSKLYVKHEPDAFGPLNSIFPIHGPHRLTHALQQQTCNIPCTPHYLANINRSYDIDPNLTHARTGKFVSVVYYGGRRGPQKLWSDESGLLYAGPWEVRPKWRRESGPKLGTKRK